MANDLTTFPIHTYTVPSLPDLGAVTDDTQIVAEHGGTGRISAANLKSYALSAATFVQKAGDTMTGGLTGTTVTTSGAISAVGTAPVDDLAMHDIGSFMLNGASSTTEFQFSHPGHFSTEALAAGIVVPSGATGYTANALGAYCQNQSTLAAGASAAYFYARNTVAGGTVFGTNVLVTDQTNVGIAGVQSTVVGCEWDIGAFNTKSTALGMNMIGVFPNGTPATAVGYQLGTLNAPWGYGFLTGDGAANNGIWLGAKATTANSDGQPIILTARDNANADHIIMIQAGHTTAGANLDLSATEGSLVVGTSGGILLGVAASGTQNLLSFSYGATGIGSFSTNGTDLNVNSAIGAVVYTTKTGTLIGVTVGGAANLVAFNSIGTAVGSITTTGTTTNYNTSSDRRLKKLLGLANGALIDQIAVYDAAFNSHPDDVYPMVVADELQGVAPFAVTGEKDAVDAEGNITPQQVDITKLVPALIAKVQTLEARLAAMEASRV